MVSGAENQPLETGGPKQLHYSSVFCVFCSMLSLLLQVYLISVGCTTYEQFKRNAAHRAMRDVAAAEAVAAAAAEAATVVLGTPDAQHSTSRRPWDGLQWQRRQHNSVVAPAAAPSSIAKPPAPYNRGFKQNWLEVLFPDQFLMQCQQQRNDGGVASSLHQRQQRRDTANTGRAGTQQPQQQERKQQ